MYHSAEKEMLLFEKQREKQNGCNLRSRRQQRVGQDDYD